MVKPLKRYRCPHCGDDLDVTQVRPLSSMPCPACHARFTVPAKHGSMLVLRKIGEGSGSIIFEADDRVLGRRVALKVMKTKSQEQLGKQDVVDEARSLMMLDHPNIVKVFAIDTHTGELCIIMELLGGGSLRDLFTKKGPVPPDRVLEIAIDVCRGLEEALKRGMYHLDVKPANIMLDEKGTAKVVDFGYAMYGLDADVADGEVPGTPYYVSPELIYRDPADHRSDIYSLGATMYHALTAQPPFQGDSIKTILRARINTQPPDPRQIIPALPASLAELVMRMMAEEPAERFSDYPTLIREMEEILAEIRPSSGPAGN